MDLSLKTNYILKLIRLKISNLRVVHKSENGFWINGDLYKSGSRKITLSTPSRRLIV